MPYLRNSITYDHDFWYTCVKWWYVQTFFFILFFNFNFWAVSGMKGQNIVQNEKNSVCHTPYLRNHTSYEFHLWYTCVMWYLELFFSFFHVLIFWVVRGVKGQKIVQNDKNLCLSCSISYETYIIWLSFVAYKFKMIISCSLFFSFF